MHTRADVVNRRVRDNMIACTEANIVEGQRTVAALEVDLRRAKHDLAAEQDKLRWLKEQPVAEEMAHG